MKQRLRKSIKIFERRVGFTFIELTTAIAIIGIISAAGASLMLFLAQNSIFIPNKLNVEMLGHDLLEIMIEGYQQAKGLRFSTAVATAANNNIKFQNADGKTVEFFWDSGNKKIYISINNGARAVIPYYLPDGIYIEQKDSNPIFTYYDVNEFATSNPTAVRRVKIEFRVRSGSGNYQDWQSQLDFASSITVRRFQ